ncbi:MAG: tetratricopeptide repeat protein, partial [Pseudomonadota bacterium]
MDRSNTTRMTGPKMSLIISTALASVALSGCTTASAPPAQTSFSKAQVALGKGQVDKAVSHAEAAVLAEPRNAGFRAMLGAAYLESGRFQSAATSFEDALELGDNDPRTVLSYALAKTALGDNASALAKLNEWQSDIDPADLGLAYALAGQPERGVHILTNALRGGQNTAKVRQNLAYTYSLAGNWRAARVMAAEDVPAGQLNERIAEWAEQSRPEAYQTRIAGLLQVSPTTDNGQPQYLALSNFPSQGMMVAEAAAQAPVAAEPNETEALAFNISSGADPVEPTPVAPASAEAAAPATVAAPAPVRTAAAEAARARFVS